jgi:hypothetical protein
MQRNVARRSKGARGLFFQAKRINPQQNDSPEKEADQTAEQVMQMKSTSDHPAFFHPSHSAGQQKRDQKSNAMMRKETAGESTGTGTVASFLSQSPSGIPLSSDVRHFFEPRFGYDFSSVKIHQDEDAVKSAQSVDALAYTVGTDIVFNKNQFNPDSEPGKKLLAHELTHVVQQKSETLQRKEIPEKNRDTEKLIKSSKMFWDDFHEAFSSYVSSDKISGTGFDKTQKEAMVVEVSKSGAIDITLGDAYLKETDDSVRKSWIKVEVIDKYIPVDRFEDLANDPTHSRLREINPPYRTGHYCALNCPATAASLSQYLKDGTINKAYCNPMLEGGKGYGFDTSMNTFSTATDWKKAAAAIKKMLKKHGDFVVVEAKRSARQQADNNLTEYHYFTVVNVKGKLFAIDAFGGGIVDDDIDNYVSNLKATTYGLLQGVFMVKLVIP